jgi:hypothetical protein
MSGRGRVAHLVLALWGLGTAVAPAPAPAGEWPFQVVTVGGRAETQPGGGAPWTVARLRAELGPGAAARTFQGRLTLTTPSGQQIRLGPTTRVSLLEPGGPDQPTGVRLDGGTVWAAVLPGGAAGEWVEVQTVPVTVSVGGGGVEITVGQDGAAMVRVYHGKAVCSGPSTTRQWSRALGDGQELVIPGGGRPGEPRKLDRGKTDPAWAKWNEDQDLAGGYRSAER